MALVPGLLWQPLLRLLLVLQLFTLYTLAHLVIPNTSTISQVHLVPRGFVLNNVTGTPEVFNPSTLQPIPQGPATDGSGSDFNAPAIIWAAFTLAVGVPMSMAGIRGWKLTTGTGIGLAATVCSWAALCNSISPNGPSDLIVDIIALAFFLAGFLLGLFEIGRLAGIVCLGIVGGLAVGVRVVLLRPGLLFGNSSLGFSGNWILAAIFGLAGGIGVGWWRTRRMGMVVACASTGTFLTVLGIDLLVNRQKGLSRGLRFLFDRNPAHIADIFSQGYSPPILTFILLAVSLLMTPILAYAQHRLFPHPFSRKPPKSSDDLQDLEDPSQPSQPVTSEREIRGTLLSGLWDTARGRFSPNRFSV